MSSFLGYVVGASVGLLALAFLVWRRILLRCDMGSHGSRKGDAYMRVSDTWYGL